MAIRKGYDEAEVKEIIDLTLEHACGGLKKKLTYNKVFTYNKKLVEEKVKRANGELFNLYGFHFWSACYLEEENYGRKMINEIKGSTSPIILAGKTFNHSMEDIVAMVEKHKNNPNKLKANLCALFSNKIEQIEALKQQNKQLNEEVIKLRENLNKFEKGFATVFYSSIYTDNSLNDVLSMKRDGDKYVVDEITSMFNGDTDKINKLKETINNNYKEKEKENVVILEEEAKLRRLKENEQMFF